MNKFTPSRICYNDSPYMLYEFLIASTPISSLGYYSISGYNTEDFKRCKASGLLDCIMDGYYDFIPVIIMTFFIFGIALTLYFGSRSINSTTLSLQPLPIYSFGALNTLLNLIVLLVFVSQSYAYYLHHQFYVYILYPD